MNPYLDNNRTSFMLEARMAFSLGLPRKVTKPKYEHHERMAEHWLKLAHDCARPDYHEAPGFATDRWGKSGRASICGREKPYGPFSRTHWRYIRLAMRSAFLAEWHRALGTTYETTEGGRRSLGVIKGLTA